MNQEPEVITIYRNARWWLLLTAFVVGSLGVLTFKVEGANPLSIAAIVTAIACAAFSAHMFTVVHRYGRTDGKKRGFWRIIPLAAMILIGGVIGNVSAPDPEPAEAHTCSGTLIDHYICQQGHTIYAQEYWYREFAYYDCIASLPQHGYWYDFAPWWAPYTDIRWVQTRTEAYCWWNYSNFGKPMPHGPYLS